MNRAEAILKNYRQSPRKVRLVADSVRGKIVSHALIELKSLPKRAADPIAKIVKSAAANAKDRFGLSPNDLIVKEISVEKGMVFKRMMPGARGRANQILKRSSHVKVVVEEKGAKKEKTPKAETKVEEVKKPAPKAPKAKTPKK